ncbi:MAG: hypothetical protein JW986_09450 [Methanotrichaceae archaeon]|nr:hypothetical protein [Methanotrichaceae archaeon]
MKSVIIALSALLLLPFLGLGSEGEPVDPLEVGDLLSPPDPYHTREYIERLTGGGDDIKEAWRRNAQDQVETSTWPMTILAGGWSLELRDRGLKRANLTLVQNGGAVFGRGFLTGSDRSQLASATGTVSASGVITLDIMGFDDLVLHRCTLYGGRDRLSGSYSAFAPDGNTWWGSVSGSRLAQQFWA